MPQNDFALTPIEAGMHKRLFGAATKKVAPISDSEMWDFLRKLRTASEVEPFCIWLIGSRIQPGRNQSDIDLVLSPRAGLWPADELIERGLWYCRNYGLYVSRPACLVDPCFRAGGPAQHIEALVPGRVLKTTKLFSPKLMRAVSAGRIRDYRRLGYFSIEYCRKAEDTDYYIKLPTQSFDGSQLPYLRPAVEVLW